MWAAIIAVLAVVAAAGAVYLVRCFQRFSFIKKLGEKHRALSWILAAVPVLVTALFAFTGNAPGAVVAMLYLAVVFLFFDLAAFIRRKMTGKETSPNERGIAAILFTVMILGAGWFAAHHVFMTPYGFSTDKAVDRNIRIVEIADAHLGVTLDGEKFARQMERIQEKKPDAVVVVGDFVDDDSSFEDLKTACRALGELDTTYGVFYVYGNHDNGYFRYRDFTPEQLRSELTKNGVTILEDESVLIGDGYCIIGRRDRSSGDRMSMDELMKDTDRSLYTIVLDHQPNDYDSEAAAGADLVLSGHTHGGHVFPAGQIGMLMGANDCLYGTQVRGDTTFVVTSGISGWGIPFKTGAISEFVVIDITGPG